MTKQEVLKIKKVLQNIKNPDSHVEVCIAVCDKQIAIFNTYKGQIKEMYDYEYDRV